MSTTEQKLKAKETKAILDFIEHAVREGWRVELYDDRDNGAVYWCKTDDKEQSLLTTQELINHLPKQE